MTVSRNQLPNRKLIVTARDFKIIEFVFEHRVASFSQLSSKFFRSSVPTTFQRLDALVKFGYLKKQYIQKVGQSFSIFQITERSVTEILDTYKYKITKNNWKSDSIEHDLAIVNWRRRIQNNSMVVDYISESALQCCEEFEDNVKLKPYVTLNSDAYLQIRGTKSTFNAAFEFEATRKTEARYAQKLKDYYFYNEVGLVIYLCENDSISNLILRIDGEISKEITPKVFVCSIQQLPTNSDSMTFFNRRGGKITIGNIQT